MEDIILLENIERYLTGQMSETERLFFEEYCANNPEVNAQIKEHKLFATYLEQYGEQKNFIAQLRQVHEIVIHTHTKKKPSSIVYLWNRYKRTIAVAASIAGITTLITSSVFTYFTPKTKPNQVQELVNKVNNIERKQTELGTTIKRVATKDNEPATPVLYNGTGFLIDGKGYLVTSAHVVKNTKSIRVQNYKGETYDAEIMNIDTDHDLAFLKITDNQYKPITHLPYTIRKNNIDLGEEIFTLGYPRKEIVYGEGYASANTGYNGDTLSCQLAISANPGNSGGPILSKNGDVVGILSARQLQADGVVFAIRSANIYRLLNQLKQEDIAYQKIKLPSYSSLKNTDRTQQIKRVKDCVFMIEVY